MDYNSVIKNILNDRKKIAQPNSFVRIWESWYRGKVPSFHSYYIYNGQKKINMKRLSMNMAKKVCEDWASLLMNEKVKIGVSSQALLEKELLKYDFYNKTNTSVEYGFGLSMACLSVEIAGLKIKESEEDKTIGTIEIDENTKVCYSIYSAKKIVPITIENGEVTELALVQENTNNTQLTIHLKNSDGTYTIIVANVDNTKEENYKFYSFNVQYPLFAIVHPQLVNSVEIDSQLPVAVFSSCIDTLKAIDIAFDSYANEFQLGRKRIFVSSEMDKVDAETGENKKWFDPNDVVIHMLPPSVSATGESKPLIQTVSDSLRVAEHSQGIQDLLNFLSSQTGLGVDYYRFEKGRVMTATQVISEKSDTFRNLKKHEGVFEKALYTIIRGLMYAHNEFTISDEKYDDIEQVSIQFDDSIIEDKQTEKQNDQKEVEFGSMSMVEYRMKWFAEDEQKAKEKVKELCGDSELQKRLEKFTPFLTQGSMTPIDFVKNVYIDLNSSEQEELAEKLKEQMATTSVEDVSNIYNPLLNE